MRVEQIYKGERLRGLVSHKGSLYFLDDKGINKLVDLFATKAPKSWNKNTEPAVKTSTEEQKKITDKSAWKQQGFKSEREWSDYQFNKQMRELKK